MEKTPDSSRPKRRSATGMATLHRGEVVADKDNAIDVGTGQPRGKYRNGVAGE